MISSYFLVILFAICSELTLKKSLQTFIVSAKFWGFFGSEFFFSFDFGLGFGFAFDLSLGFFSTGIPSFSLRESASFLSSFFFLSKDLISFSVVFLTLFISLVLKLISASNSLIISFFFFSSSFITLLNSSITDFASFCFASFCFFISAICFKVCSNLFLFSSDSVCNLSKLFWNIWLFGSTSKSTLNIFFLMKSSKSFSVWIIFFPMSLP